MGHVLDETGELTDQQVLFARKYVANGCNGTRAAIDAGYDPASAHSTASALLRIPKVARYVRKLLDEILPDNVRSWLAEMSGPGNDVAAMAEALQAGRTVEELRAAGYNTSLIKSITRSPRKHGESVRVEGYSRLDAIEKLGKIYAMFVDRTESINRNTHDFGDLPTAELQRLAHVTDDSDSPENSGAQPDAQDG